MALGYSTNLSFSFFPDLKKTFDPQPYSVNVEMDRQATIRCHPPEGIPPPTVFWLKNGAVLEPDSNIIVSREGHLLFSQARFQDTANYTCVAENIAAKRLSDTVLLKVIGKFCFEFLAGGCVGAKEFENGANSHLNIAILLVLNRHTAGCDRHFNFSSGI